MQRPSWSIVGALVLAAGPAFGQHGQQERDQPVATASETVEVRVINIDVEVLDRKGRPVLGLGRDDFELEIDGQPAAISNFASPGPVPGRGETERAAAPAREPSAPRPAPDVPPAAREAGSTPPALPRVVLFLDERFLDPGDRRRVLRQLAKWVDETRFEASWLVLRQLGRAETLVATDDRAEVRQALERLTRDPTTVSVSAERDRVLDTIESIGPCSLRALQEVRLYGAQTLSSSRHTLAALGGVLAQLAAIDGRKSLLYVGNGMQMQPGGALLQILAGACDSSQLGLIGAGDGLYEDLSQLAAAANAARVTIHSFEARGLEAPTASKVSVNPLKPAEGDQPSDGRSLVGQDFGAGELPIGGGQQALRSSSLDSLDRYNTQESLFALADLTGGMTVFNTNSFRKPLRELEQRFGSVYSLGYQVEGPADNATHRVVVRTRFGDRYQVRHRKSFVLRERAQLLAARLDGALMGIASPNPLAARLEVAGVEPGEDTYAATLRLLVPADRVVLIPAPGVEKRVREGGLLVYLRSARSIGSNKAPAVTRFPLRLTGERAPADPAPTFQFDLEVVLDDKTRSVAAAVVDERSGETSVLTVEIAPLRGSSPDRSP